MKEFGGSRRTDHGSFIVDGKGMILEIGRAHV